MRGLDRDYERLSFAIFRKEPNKTQCRERQGFFIFVPDGEETLDVFKAVGDAYFQQRTIEFVNECARVACNAKLAYDAKRLLRLGWPGLNKKLLCPSPKLRLRIDYKDEQFHCGAKAQRIRVRQGVDDARFINLLRVLIQKLAQLWDDSSGAGSKDLKRTRSKRSPHLG